jgi:hypothetical protein
MKRRALAEILGCNEKSIDRAVKELIEKNLVEKKVITITENLTFNHYRPKEKNDWMGINKIEGGIPKMDSPGQNRTGMDTSGEGHSNFDQGGIPKMDRGMDKNDHHSQTEYSQTEIKQTGEKDEKKSDARSIPPNPQSFSTAKAVVVNPPDFSPIDSFPKKRKKMELTPEQNELYHAAKLCFESSEKAKALMYQDQPSAAMQMKKLKDIIVRCSNIAPGITVDFLKAVLEHFQVMTNSAKYKGSWVFTPRCLSTYWVWGLVISSLPERETELDKSLQESIKGLFKER